MSTACNLQESLQMLANGDGIMQHERPIAMKINGK